MNKKQLIKELEKVPDNEELYMWDGEFGILCSIKRVFQTDYTIMKDGNSKYKTISLGTNSKTYKGWTIG